MNFPLIFKRLLALFACAGGPFAALAGCNRAARLGPSGYPMAPATTRQLPPCHLLTDAQPSLARSCGGTICKLGTKKHHDAYLDGIDSLALPGCFGMTELGHGSNVMGIETTVRRSAGGGVLVTCALRARRARQGTAGVR